ncbi:MAG TPA: PD-(D/E)XK nuclease family protein, partial [Gaiellaceae bacterium]|nr:PD-(D/E)XK nuclease family protein [Gaiellaceae bacterium]
LTVNVGLIKSKGSEWYWNKFQKGGTIAIKSGNSTMFVTKVEQAKTVKIASLQRSDFVGLFTAQRMAGKSTYQLRALLVQDLKDRQARKPGAPTPVSTQSQVRIVRFMSSIKARDLPENKDESAYPVAPRSQFELPQALQGLNHLLPKTVIVDMRLFPDGVPYPLIEDMTKLMKTGVYIVLLSPNRNEGAGSVEDLLTKQLSIKQRDQISRYKMVILSDDGNSLSGYSGNFSKPLPSVRFTPQQLEIVNFVAQSQGAVVDAKTTRVDVTLAKGADVAAKLAALKSAVAGMSLNPDAWQWNVSERDGKPVISIRPQNLVSALPHLLEVMREHEGVYANNTDIMVISKDEALLAALPGSVQPSAHSTAVGSELADQALASLLGPYRENKPGDLAASASKISSFLNNPNGGFGGFGNIYMMTGHIMHSAFNWAIWRYRNTGVLPTAEETVAMGRQIWEHEAAAAGAKNLLGRPGESLAGFYETVEMRLLAMHSVAADVLKTYPIAVGTELANMVVVPRFKKGGLDGRDIFRLIFDFVVARETKDGKIEMVIVDFKTGQVPTLQSLEKDTQVQLYDLLVRQMWKELPVAPYGGNGVRREVVDYKLNFLYTAGAYQPELNDWSRMKFDKFLRNVMNRIRRHNNPQPTKKALKEAADAAKAKAKKGAPAKAAAKKKG